MFMFRLVTAALLGLPLVAAAEGAAKMRLGLFTASLPWLFGPYQNQMYQLSLLLHNAPDEQYDICWLTFADNAALPPGEYAIPDSETYHQSSLHRFLPNVIPPGDDFELGHITFLGGLDGGGGKLREGLAKGSTPTSHINAFASQYRLDAVLTLMDINRIVPDVPLDVPVVGWVPLHFATLRKSSTDYWSLRALHAVGVLAPGMKPGLEGAVGSVPKLDGGVFDAGVEHAAGSVGRVAVDFVPHIIERAPIAKLAARATELLGFLSVAHADSALSARNQPPILDRGQERTLTPGHNRSLFGNPGGGAEGDPPCGFNRTAIDSTTFVVLLQGGNYDEADRKGWDTSVQAFVRFYNRLRDSDGGKIKCPRNVHLLIHSMDSYLMESDAHNNADAPAQVMPKGHVHHKLFHETGLPRHTYTIDIAKHHPGVVAAYKQRASVCLHPSKVEGFGMNVVECQAVGTPVITTNYTAMGDYTRLGRSVPHRQTIKVPGVPYEMALPDVEGIANALTELYEEHAAMASGKHAATSKRGKEVAAAHRWIDTSFSPDAVAPRLRALLRDAADEKGRRARSRDAALALRRLPSSGAYEQALGHHAPIADWDAPWTLLAPEGLRVPDPAALHRACWEATLRGRDTNVMALPIAADGWGGTPLADHTPLLVRTYMVAGFQQLASRRTSLVGLAIQQAVNPQMLSPGLVYFEEESGSAGSSSSAPGSEKDEL